VAKANITKRTVDSIQPSDRDQFVWDTDLSGFGLKVTPAGRKVYIYQYRIAAPGAADRTPAKRYTIGKHGALTPDQARKRAEQLAGMVANGIDPRQSEIDRHAAENEAKQAAAEKARLEGDLAFENIAALWLDHYEHEKGRRPSSIRQAKLVVDKHLKPRLAHKPLPHIGRSDLQPIIDAIPVVQKGMRRAVFAYASVLFGWAARRGDIPANPLADMEKPVAPKPRDRVLSDVEVLAVWNAAASVSEPFDSFFRLLILTGQRRGEVAGMAWAELDRATTTWTVPADRAKNGVAHIVPLSAPVVAELHRLSKAAQKGKGIQDENKWPKVGLVLTTTGKTPISGITKAKSALDAAVPKSGESGPLPGWRIHDIRRTVATGFQRLGIRFEVTEAVLNHISGAKGGIAGVYQRHDWKDEKRAALEAWARHLRELASPAEQDDVVSLDAVKRSA